MADDNKPPTYDNAGYAPPFTTPPQYPPFQQPYAGPPPNGAPYNPPQQQTGYYPGNAYPPPPGQQMQQPQVIVVNSQAGVVPAASVSMGCALALSCVTFWLFGWLFGGIAFVLAILGQNAAAVGDKRGAIQLRNASYGVSIAGIVIGIIVIGVIVGVAVSSANAVAQTYYYSPYCYYNSYGIYTCN